jgi:hypothetical protein
MNRSVPSEPPQVGAITVSETDQQMKRKASGRKRHSETSGLVQAALWRPFVEEFVAPV